MVRAHRLRSDARGCVPTKRAALPKWSEIYPLLHYSWIRQVKQVVDKPVLQKELAFLVLNYHNLLFDDLEALASKHRTSWKVLSLAAIYLYGTALDQRGDYFEVTGREPNWLTKVLQRARCVASL